MLISSNISDVFCVKFTNLTKIQPLRFGIFENCGSTQSILNYTTQVDNFNW